MRLSLKILPTIAIFCTNVKNAQKSWNKLLNKVFSPICFKWMIQKNNIFNKVQALTVLLNFTNFCTLPNKLYVHCLNESITAGISQQQNVRCGQCLPLILTSETIYGSHNFKA